MSSSNYHGRALCLIGLLLSAAGLAACQQSPLQAVGAIEDASTAALLISGTDTIAKYLDDPSVVCTGFLPTNEGLTKAFEMLGSYAGLLASNETMVKEVLNYHVVPGKALKAADLKDGQVLTTRQGEDMHVSIKGKDMYIWSIPSEPVKVVKRDIPAGKCSVFLIDFIMAPPSYADLLLDLKAKAAAAAAEGDPTANPVEPPPATLPTQPATTRSAPAPAPTDSTPAPAAVSSDDSSSSKGSAGSRASSSSSTTPTIAASPVPAAPSVPSPSPKNGAAGASWAAASLLFGAGLVLQALV